MTNILPEGWTESRVDQFLVLQRGFDLPVQNRIDGDFPIYGSNGIVGQHNEPSVQGPCVVTGRSGSIGDVWFIQNDFWALNTSLYVKEFYGNDRKYAYYYLDWFDLSRFGGGTGVPTLNRNDVHCISAIYPPLPEQQKIATILSSVDNVIEKTRAQIDKLKDLKTGMMQELLTKGIGHTEFKDSPVGRIPASWNVKQISDVCSEIVDCVNKTAQVVDYVTPYRMIRTTNVRDGRIIMEGMRYVTEDTFNAWSRRLLLQTGDLIFTREAPVGECGLLQESAGLFLGQRTMVYRADTKKIDNIFLLATMQSEYFQAQIEDLSGGSTTPHLRVPDCSKILLKVPSLQEQNKISSSIASVDNAVEKNRNKLEQLSSIKKALMQDLLTGKVRVKLTDKESAVV